MCLFISLKFRSSFSVSTKKKKMLDFDWDCFNLINHLTKNWHFNNTASLDLGTGHSSSFVQAVCSLRNIYV